MSQQMKQNRQFDFEIFAINLSILLRGTFNEKVRWFFNFYDLNRDGLISIRVSKIKYFFKILKK